MTSIFNGINNSVFTNPINQNSGGSGASSILPTSSPPILVTNNNISLDVDNLISILSINNNLIDIKDAFGQHLFKAIP